MTTTPRPSIDRPTGALRDLTVTSAVLLMATAVVFALVYRLTPWRWLDLLGGLVAGALLLVLPVLVVAAVQRLAGRLLAAAGRPAAAARARDWPPQAVAWPALVLTLVVLPPLSGGESEITPGAVGAIVLVAGLATGILLGAARRRGARAPARGLVAAALALDLGVVALLAVPWPAGEVATLAPAATAALDLPNPGDAGPFAVARLTYGSGIGRPAFGADAALHTDPVDLSRMYDGGGALYDWHVRWRTGARPAALPVNGTVWYPEGAGRHPLVLIVHGNHTVGEASDPGYAWLAEHLASHGDVVVSVDENFLNGSAIDDPDGREMPARALVLVEHLRQWERWAADPTSPFAGRVDLDRVVLIGHSRGGEAVAHAAALVTGPDRLADAPSVHVAGVVALAPTDGLWTPGGRARSLTDVAYLAVGGALDADLRPFFGLAQWGRVRLTPATDAFAAYAYLQRADHSQFNTRWGRADAGPVDSPLLNRAPLLSGEEQRGATRTLVTAFVRAVAEGDDGYRAVFARPDTARDWLPDDVVVTGYRDATVTSLAAAEPSDLTMAHGPLLARDGEHRLDDAVTRLAWIEGAAPTLTFAPPASLTTGAVLTLRYGADTDSRRPGDVRVTLEDGAGTAATATIREVTTIRPPLPLPTARLPWLLEAYDVIEPIAWRSERVLQTYEIPLDHFTAAPALDVANLRRVTLGFDGSRDGRVLLDDVGFRLPTGAERAAAG